jgi:hypothetical protein
MASFDITVTLDVSEPHEYHNSKTRHVEIPPAYGLEDRRRFYAVRLEDLTEDFFEEQGWLAPLRHALLANAARLTRIEELIEDDDSPLADDIRGVIEAGSQAAIEQWGSEPIEDS